MRITAVETVLVDRYLFVKVHTDAGIAGLGESGAWGYLEASQKAIPSTTFTPAGRPAAKLVRRVR